MIYKSQIHGYSLKQLNEVSTVGYNSLRNVVVAYKETGRTNKKNLNTIIKQREKSKRDKMLEDAGLPPREEASVSPFLRREMSSNRNRSGYNLRHKTQRNEVVASKPLLSSSELRIKQLLAL